jgi:hypothetical protein
MICLHLPIYRLTGPATNAEEFSSCSLPVEPSREGNLIVMGAGHSSPVQALR